MDGSADYEHLHATAAPGHAEEATRPVADTSGPLSVTLTRAQGEALSDAPYGPPQDWWPIGWIEHQQAHSAAVAAVEAALNGTAQPGALELLDRAQVVLDHALHAELSRAATEADVLVLASHLHLVRGCWVARAADPVAVEPGGYRRDRDAALPQHRAGRAVAVVPGRGGSGAGGAGRARRQITVKYRQPLLLDTTKGASFGRSAIDRGRRRPGLRG